MTANSRSIGFVLRQPSAFIPVAMSVLALAIVLIHIALYGPAREADEGATAHLWQLLMVGQIPILLFFAIRWLPRPARLFPFSPFKPRPSSPPWRPSTSCTFRAHYTQVT
jgi:hypothetical protein